MQGGLVLAKSGRLELGDNIYGHYRCIFNHWTDFSSVLSQFTHLTDWQTNGRTDGQTEFSSLDRVCIPCSAVKKTNLADICLAIRHVYHCVYNFRSVSRVQPPLSLMTSHFPPSRTAAATARSPPLSPYAATVRRDTLIYFTICVKKTFKIFLKH